MFVNKFAHFMVLGLVLLISACDAEPVPDPSQKGNSLVMKGDDAPAFPPNVVQYIDTDGDAPFNPGCVWQTGNTQGFGDCADNINPIFPDVCLSTTILREQLACGQGQCCLLRGAWTYDCNALCAGQGGGVCTTRAHPCNNNNQVAYCRCNGGGGGGGDGGISTMDMSIGGGGPPDLF